MAIGALLVVPFLVLSYLEIFGVREFDPDAVISTWLALCCWSLSAVFNLRCELDEQEEFYDEEIACLKAELAKYTSAEQSERVFTTSIVEQRIPGDEDFREIEPPIMIGKK